MPRGYNHLTQDQRCQIYTLKKSGNTQSLIALHVGINQSVVSRELKWNCGERGYRYKQAHEKAAKRRSDAAPMPHKMHPELKLTEGISISHECIYLHIWDDMRNGGNLFKNLRRIGKKHNKRRCKLAGRGLIPNRVGIEHRPAEVEAKVRVGDFEADTIIGADHHHSWERGLNENTNGLVRQYFPKGCNFTKLTQK